MTDSDYRGRPEHRPAMTPYLAALHIYPLKAGRAVDLSEASVEPWGLAGDRRWLLVEPDGTCVTQRDHPTLALVTVRYVAPGRGPAGSIEVSAGGGVPLKVPAPAEDRGAEMLWVTVWSAKVLAAAAGPDADGWFSRYVGRPVRLVYLDDPTRRQVDPDFGRPGDRVSFADGYPLLLTTLGSLEALGDWLIETGDEPVPMSRFRPSAVIAGTAAWAEDDWHRVQIGAVPLRVAKPCGRCVVTTIDQATAERGRQPLQMLGRRRNIGQQLVFGQNAIPDGPGTIRVGDPVQILA